MFVTVSEISIFKMQKNKKLHFLKLDAEILLWLQNYNC